MLAVTQRVAGYILPGHDVRQSPAADPDTARQRRHAGDASHPPQTALFAPGQDSPQPAHRQPADALTSIELANHLSRRPLVQRRGRPGIVLEDLDAPMHHAVDDHLGGWVLSPQDAEDGRTGPARRFLLWRLYLFVHSFLGGDEGFSRRETG